MSRRFWQTAAIVTAGISSLAALILHGYLGSYSRFMADDFCSAGMARRLGMLRAVWYWYRNWTGRYSATALDAVFGLLGPAVTPFVTALVLLIWLAALTQTARILLRQYGGNILHAAVIASVILHLTVTLSPNVPQSLYWGQGMRSIVPPLILSTVLGTYLMLLRTPRIRGQGSKLALAGSFLLALVIGGFSETFAALQLGGLAFACILSRSMPDWKSRQFLTGLLFAAVLGATIAMAIVVLSPGNTVRQAFYPPPPALPQLLEIAWANFGSFLTRLARAPEGLLAIFGALALSAFMGSQAQQRPFGCLTPGVLLVAGLGLVFASFIPAAYSLSDSPPERTLLVPTHLLTLTLMLEGFLLGGVLGQRVTHPKMPWLATVVLLMASVLLVTSAALSGEKLLSSRLTYLQYSEHWDAVDLQIRSAKNRGEKQIWIQPIANWAGLNEPNDNPKFWVNLCLREYYGIEVLGLDMP